MVTASVPGGSRTERLVYILVGSGIVAGFLSLLLWDSIVIPINTGHVGVYFSRFFGGTVTKWIEPEGVAFKLPWDKILIVDVRTQTRTFSVPTLSSEGMRTEVDLTVLFRPWPDLTPLLLKKIGPEYADKVVGPLAIETLRESIGQVDSMLLYRVDNKKIQTELLARLRAEPVGDYIEFQDLIVKRIILPDQISKAIEEKLAQEQMSLSYKFRLDRQKQEAERLRIEAIGLQNFYSVVADSLTEQLLTWRGIEATLKLAESPNAKVVIIGADGNLPLILGNEIQRLPPPGGTQKPVPGHHSPLPQFNEMPPIFEDKMDIPSTASGLKSE